MSRILPILFNADMVRAIMDGRKTVTRRTMKSRLIDTCPHCSYIGIDYIYDEMAKNIYCARCGDPVNPEIKSPYQKNDILYVRETWNNDWCGHCIYKADGGSARAVGYDEEPKWRPSIHMPREVARIWLKVTSVRVERLKDITNEEILKEGANDATIRSYVAQMPDDTEEWIRTAYILEWSQLWDKTAASDNQKWEANPWVWAIEFDRCDKPQEG